MNQNQIEYDVLIAQAYLYCSLYFQTDNIVYAELYQELFNKIMELI